MSDLKKWIILDPDLPSFRIVQVELISVHNEIGDAVFKVTNTGLDGKFRLLQNTIYDTYQQAKDVALKEVRRRITSLTIQKSQHEHRLAEVDAELEEYQTAEKLLGENHD